MKLRVNDAINQIISSKLVDMVVYGNECGDEDINYLLEIHPDIPKTCSDLMISTNPSACQVHGISRCGNGIPLEFNTYVSCTTSPLAENSCPNWDEKQTLQYPFLFQGRPLQSTAQQLALNVWYSVKMLKLYPAILEGRPIHIAARLLGVGTTTISNKC